MSRNLDLSFRTDGAYYAGRKSSRGHCRLRRRASVLAPIGARTKGARSQGRRRAREARHQAEQQRSANNSEWCRWADQRIGQHLGQQFGLLHDALGQVIAQERAARRKELEAAIKEAERAIDTQLAALEQRLKAMPGKLPVAKTWHPESVTYQAEFVCHEGALWQARKDTAQAPGGSDWGCVSRGGRDGLTPTVRGTYDTSETYNQLDIVVSDGAAFIARHDDPGLCPGEGWQLLSRQGRPGRRGETGEPGPRGAKGERGEAAPTIASWPYRP